MELLGDADALTDELGLRELLGLTLAETDALGLLLDEGLRLNETLALGENDPLGEIEADTELLGEMLGD